MTKYIFAYKHKITSDQINPDKEAIGIMVSCINTQTNEQISTGNNCGTFFYNQDNRIMQQYNFTDGFHRGAMFQYVENQSQELFDYSNAPNTPGWYLVSEDGYTCIMYTKEVTGSIDNYNSVTDLINALCNAKWQKTNNYSSAYPGLPTNSILSFAPLYANYYL